MAFVQFCLLGVGKMKSHRLIIVVYFFIHRDEEVPQNHSHTYEQTFGFNVKFALEL